MTEVWYARGQIPYRRDRILPTGFLVMLVNLGPPIRTVAGGADQTNRAAWVCGMQTAAMLNQPLSNTHVVGASFDVAGAYPLLGLPITELTDRVVQLDDLWGGFTAEIRERLYALPSAQAKLDAFERLLSRRLVLDADPIRRIRRAIPRVCSTRQPSIRGVSAEIGVSHRHLVSEFKRLVGTGPKVLARIQRFNRLLTEIDPRRAVRWAAEAAAHGYADQAHLAREFKALSGITASQYLDARRRLLGPDLGPGQAVSFVPE